jgi:transposase
MSKPTTRPPRDWREGRRLRAWELHQDIWTGKAIAAALGVTPVAVSQWLKRVRDGGAGALRHQPALVPQPRLTAEQLVPALLTPGAEAYGFVGEVWTTPRVAVVIQRDAWGELSSGPCRPPPAPGGMECPEARGAGDPARRGGHRALGHRALARHQKEAAAGESVHARGHGSLR